MSTQVPERGKKETPSLPQRRERGLAGEGRYSRLIGWQGLLVNVPENWDLTGFSGDELAGYVRMDDGEEQALEVKWATESAPKRPWWSKGAGEAAAPPDVEVRRESYFRLLKQNAKKKKLAISTQETEPLRSVLRPERTASGFTWTADRKGIGAVWYCGICRRVVIAQVLGAPSGKGGLTSVAEAVLGSLRCHGDDPAWRTWALYDLVTQVPAEYRLESQELMNVYLRLTFARKTARVAVEQWSLANVARRNAYLDVWLSSNTRSAELSGARYTVEESEEHGHPAITLRGGLAFGMPMVQAVREATRLQRPATRFAGVAWECEPSNKVFAISELRPGNAPGIAAAVAERTLCHTEDASPRTEC